MQNKFTTLMLALGFLSIMNQAQSQIVLNEIGADGRIEIKNIGTTGVNVLDYYVCNAVECIELDQLSIICPFPPTPVNPLGSGSILVAVSDLVGLGDGEIALFSSSSTTDPSALVDYVQWGTAGHPSESLAATAGLWSSGAFVPAIPTDGSLEYDGNGNEVSDWALAFVPSACDENGTGCQVIAGTIQTDDSTFICVNDSIDNYLFVSFSGNGSPSWYNVVTDSIGTIQDYVPESTSFNFEGAPFGTSFIYMLGYQGQLIGLEIGANLDSLEGCIDLSDNFIEITKVGCISGVNEWHRELSQLILSPNPVDQVLHLSKLPYSQTEDSVLEIYNSIGKLTTASSVSNNFRQDISINTDQLQPGIYFLKISAGGFSGIRKFIKL